MIRLVSILLMVAGIGHAMASPLPATDASPLAQLHFSDPQKQRRFVELKAELRCPMCQNQNISDSNALIAVDLKRKVYDLVEQGKSKQQVIDYMKARYGDFVHYQPPITPVTVWLWVLPILFIGGAAFAIVMRRPAELPEHQQASGVVADLEEKADKLMDKYQ